MAKRGYRYGTPKVPRGIHSAYAGPNGQYTANHTRYAEDVCDAKPDGQQAFTKRVRQNDTPNGPAGSTYSMRYRTGDKCGAPAVVVKKMDNGIGTMVTVRRCLKHLRTPI
jgi:hypothetical protein